MTSLLKSPLNKLVQVHWEDLQRQSLLIEQMDINEKVQMATVSDQLTMSTILTISQQCIPKVLQLKIVLQVVMLMRHVLHSTMTQ
jgi:hypothetical protein